MSCHQQQMSRVEWRQAIRRERITAPTSVVNFITWGSIEHLRETLQIIVGCDPRQVRSLPQADTRQTAHCGQGLPGGQESRLVSGTCSSDVCRVRARVPGQIAAWKHGARGLGEKCSECFQTHIWSSGCWLPRHSRPALLVLQR